MKKVLISLLVGVTLCGGLFGCGEETVSKAKYDEVVKSNEQLVENNENLVKDKQELQAKIDSAKDYFELDENEKEIVDAKIVEVNQATEDQLAQEKAQKEAEEEAKRQAEEEAKRQAESQKYETGLTWEQIAREGRVGELGKFEGKIVQVMSGSGFTQYRVAINGDYDTIMLIEVLDGISSEVLLEDDYVYFKGMSMGQYTYTTVLGSEMTIPSFIVDEINR